MYRILIVDDEKIEREVIRFLINKFGFDLDIVEAENGKEAINILKECHVDILLTDVKMPFIDGMELAEKVRHVHNDMEIIFFSGYSDFNLVKKALTLRADNYILKPVKPEEFNQTLNAVIDTIRKKDEEKERTEVNLAFTKKHIVYRLLNQSPIEMLKQEYYDLNFDFLESYNRMMLVHSDSDFLEGLIEENSGYIYEEINKVSNCIKYDLIDLNQFQIILLFKDSKENTEIYRKIAESIHRGIEERYGITVVIAVSEPITETVPISKTYSQLENDIKDRFFYSDTYIYPVDKPLSDNQEFEEDEILLREVERAIEHSNISNLRNNVSNLIQKYSENANVSEMYLRFLLTRLLQRLFRAIPEKNKEDMNRYIELIYSHNHYSDIRDTILEIENQAEANLKNGTYLTMDPIEKVKQYISININQDLSLDMLADEVSLTPGYLSDKFKEETGLGIIKYIKEVRMEKAEDMLSRTDMKVNDISRSVGYNNVSYFIKIFRGHFGISPKKYREIKQRQVK
ncbi:response regulator transcription factor [Corticicoccus populi]|uniref:Response regulator n=1 Tax=Corticicoccus populi TaxID=1812821 RepID=A0ABW5X024_9STAP